MADSMSRLKEAMRRKAEQYDDEDGRKAKRANAVARQGYDEDDVHLESVSVRPKQGRAYEVGRDLDAEAGPDDKLQWGDAGVSSDKLEEWRKGKKFKLLGQALEPKDGYAQQDKDVTSSNEAYRQKSQHDADALAPKGDLVKKITLPAVDVSSEDSDQEKQGRKARKARGY